MKSWQGGAMAAALAPERLIGPQQQVAQVGAIARHAVANRGNLAKHIPLDFQDRSTELELSFLGLR